MKNYIYILFFLLLPSLGFSQIVISGSGEITASGTADIVLTGDWTNNATATSFTASTGAGLVYFISSIPQSIGGSQSTTFGKLKVKNPSGITTNSDIIVTDTMTFKKGIVHVASGKMFTFQGNNCKARLANKKKFIDGPVTHIGSSAFTYPIGDGTKFAPIRTYTTTSSVTITAQYYKAIPPNNTSVSAPLVKVSDVEYWHLTSSSGADTKVRILWKNGAESGIHSLDYDSLKFAKWDGSNWVDELAKIGIPSTLNKGYISTKNKQNFTDLYVTFGSTDNVSNPLPIELLSFTAQCQEQDVVVNWSTASEENNQYFTLLRSDDAEHYEEIAQISGAGNSNEILNYSYSDWNAAGGSYYYMLKQTDYNGESETFDPVHVNCSQEKEVTLKMLYDGENAYALLSNAQSGSNYNMMIIDHTGRVLIQETQRVITQNYYRIPKEQLSSGLYSIIYFTDDGSVRLNEKVFIR